MRLAQITGIDSPATNFSDHNTLVKDIVSRILLYAVAAAGFYFFIRVILAGFALLTSTGEPGKVQSAKKQLTNGVIGLLVVTTAYFVGQIIQTVFGINFL